MLKIRSDDRVTFSNFMLILLCVLGLTAFSVSYAQKDSKSSSVQDSKSLSIEEHFAILSYGIGFDLIDQASALIGEGEINEKQLLQGIQDAIANKERQFSREQIVESFEVIGNISEEHKMLEAKKNKEAADQFLEENKNKKGVVTLDSGLQYEVLEEGKGAKPQKSDYVVTHYHGTLMDGSVFDSSVKRGEPAEFPVSGVISGWIEALQLMPVGSKWKLYVPPHLAYGERGAGNIIAPNSLLIFEIQLLEIK